MTKQCALIDDSAAVPTVSTNSNNDSGALALYREKPTIVGGYSWDGMRKVETHDADGWSYLTSTR